MARLRRLASLGRELRRPEVDYLRDGIYELRARQGRIHYRVLYFFHGRDTVVLAHGLTKEGGVPEAAIERAFRRKKEFKSDPESHSDQEMQ